VNAFRIVPAGDAALVVEFEARIDPSVNARAIRLAEALQAACVPGVLDVVPTFRSVAIYFDPLHTNSDVLFARVEAEAAKPSSDTGTVRPAVRVPVCYGGELGPDLAAVAAFSHLSEAEVIAAHTARTYRAFMVGFVPGFAYLGIVEERIAMPRRDTPRVRVPIGSVGIAGVQTGIYPMETPGGWRLIGRTHVKPYDHSRREPFLFKPGDRVRFRSINRAEFERTA
jgi:inhibitor of KinA